MQASDIPSKIQLPFAASAGADFIRTVPVPSQIGITDGAASFTDGFPPNVFIPEAAGGFPPDGRDVNKLFNITTAWIRWANAGGRMQYDSTYQSEIGGYPLGALIMSGVTNGLYWLSTVDNNTTNPDSGGAGWKPVDLSVQYVQQGGGIGQLTNKVYIGWSAVGLKATIDVTDQGVFAFQSWVGSNFDALGDAAAVLSTSLQKSANLSDLGNLATALGNLGFSATLSVPAIYRLPFGLILQIFDYTVGSVAGAGGTATATINYPVAFPSGSFISIPIDGGAQGITVGCNTFLANSFQIFVKNFGSTVTVSGRCLALGI